MATTAERLATLETILGAQHLNKSSDDLRAALTPANTIPGGRYPYILDSYQLHAQFDELLGAGGTIESMRAEIVALKARPVIAPTVNMPPVIPPVVSGAFDVQSALAAYDIHVAPGKMSIGWEVDTESQACLQLGGRVPAEMSGRSNVNRTDGQNRDEPHLNTVVLCDNDGSWSVRQYTKWWNGAVRNTLNRAYTRLSIDSKGDLCCSDDRWPQGQVWYIRKTAGFVDFCSYQVGTVVRVLKSVAGYGAADTQVL